LAASFVMTSIAESAISAKAIWGSGDVDVHAEIDAHGLRFALIGYTGPALSASYRQMSRQLAPISRWSTGLDKER